VENSQFGREQGSEPDQDHDIRLVQDRC